jgi:hypothetical protein
VRDALAARVAEAGHPLRDDDGTPVATDPFGIAARLTAPSAPTAD